MDATRFDRLVRSLTAPTSRRRAVLAVLTGLGSSLAPGPATAAKKRRKKKRCRPKCAGKVCGPNGCRGTCGRCAGNESCAAGTCACVPECAASNACGPDGCGGSCGGCAGSTCQGATLTTHECAAGVCTPVVADCAPGQVCFQNACCTRITPPSCRKVAVNDGCGGTFPANCAQNCCEAPGGGFACQATPCQ